MQDKPKVPPPGENIPQKMNNLSDRIDNLEEMVFGGNAQQPDKTYDDDDTFDDDLNGVPEVLRNQIEELWKDCFGHPRAQSKIELTDQDQSEKLKAKCLAYVNGFVQLSSKGEKVQTPIFEEQYERALENLKLKRDVSQNQAAKLFDAVHQGYERLVNQGTNETNFKEGGVNLPKVEGDDGQPYFVPDEDQNK